MRNITPSNIMEYISDRKGVSRLINKKRKRFFWSRQEWKVLQQVVTACTCNLFTVEGGMKIKPGFTFLGVRHYKKK